MEGDKDEEEDNFQKDEDEEMEVDQQVLHEHMNVWGSDFKRIFGGPGQKQHTKWEVNSSNEMNIKCRDENRFKPVVWLPGYALKGFLTKSLHKKDFLRKLSVQMLYFCFSLTLRSSSTSAKFPYWVSSVFLHF